MSTRILIAGFGNLLRGDDGFGVTVIQRLSASLDQQCFPDGVKVMEVGISGVSLVHELMIGYDVVLVVDAVDRGEKPGTAFQIEPSIKDLSAIDMEAQREFLSDMHYTEPSRALALAKALGVLPARVLILGCQPMTTEELGIGLSPSVDRAAVKTVEQIHELTQEFTRENFVVKGLGNQ